MACAIHAEMEQIGDWGLPDESPLHGLCFLLDFGSPELDGVMVYQGHVLPVDKTASPFGKSASVIFWPISGLPATCSSIRKFRPQVSAESPAIDTPTVERTLARAAIWLTPKSVACFNAADFPELGPAGQQELLSAVQHFVTADSGVPADQPPTNEQYRNAAAAFQPVAVPTEGDLRRAVSNAYYAVFHLLIDHGMTHDPIRDRPGFQNTGGAYVSAWRDEKRVLAVFSPEREQCWPIFRKFSITRRIA